MHNGWINTWWRTRLVAALAGLACAAVSAAPAEAPSATAVAAPTPLPGAELIVYTEDWPPYNYEQDGAIKGIATDILRQACAKAAVKCPIEVVPWARGYHLTKQRPNRLLYTTARKPSREAEFLWVGPILPRTTWIYGRPGSERALKSLADLASARVGVVRGEAAQQDMEKAGVPATAFVIESETSTVLRQLTRNITDVMVETEAGMAWSLRNAGLPATTVTRLMKLSEEGAYYFALNLKSDPELVRKLQQAVDTLRREGTIDAISREYGVRK